MGKHPEAAATAAEPAPGVAATSPRGEAGGREDDPLLYRRRFGTTGFQHAGPMSKATYAFIGEDSAAAYLPQADTAQELAARFDATYAQVKAEQERRRRRCSPSGLMWRILVHLGWTATEIGTRVGAPLVLRQLITWFSGYEASGGNTEARRGCCVCCLYPVWRGWMWAAVMGVFGYCYCFIHHQLFWYGMRLGYDMRQQAVAAVQAKVLNLNSVAVGDQTAGKIVNLVSNDVRRFDDALPFYNFLLMVGLWLELMIVFVLVGAKLGYWASLAGVATLLALIPTQSALAAFGVARATSTDQLTVPNLFYSLALLALPKLYMCDFFVLAVGSVSELRISMRRLGAFLSLPEPPKPWHATPGASAGSGGGATANGRDGAPGGQQETPAAAAEAAVEVAGADFDWADRSWAEPAAAAAPAAGSARDDEPAAAAAFQAVQATAGQQAAGEAAPAPPAFQLRGLRFSVARGSLVGIVGTVGSGKSSVLAALLGELQPTQRGGASAAGAGVAAAPPVTVRGSVAYSSQVPWIVSSTVKENILFGQRYEATQYEAVLRACALEDDITALPAGDETELGERGINLSGGQKARLALARAAYSQAEIQLLDDPLSAVDPRVGRILFDDCIAGTGLMAGTTRLLVTHQRQFLPGCDEVLVLRGGEIAHRGTHAELAAAGVPEVIASQETSLDDSTYDSHGAAPPSAPSAAAAADGAPGGSPAGSGSQQEEQAEEQVQLEQQPPPADGHLEGDEQAERQLHASVAKTTRFDRSVSVLFGEAEGGAGGASRGAGWRRKLSGSYVRRAVSARFASGQRRARVASKGEGEEGSEEEQEQAAGKGSLQPGKSGRLIVAEDHAVGSVPWAVYGRYGARMGLPVVTLITAGLLLGQAIYLFGDYWLSLWASKDGEAQREVYWVWGYAIMVGAILAISFSRSLLFFMASLRASTQLHDEMVQRVLRAPLSFFHTSPTGRILNRFSKDQGQVDEQLPQVFFDCVLALMMVLGAFALLMVSVPFIIPLFLPLGAAFFLVRARYLRTSREIKRWEATSRSPVFASFSAILKGLPTIRAFGAGPRFRSAFLQELSDNGAWWFCFLTTARWIGFRLDLLVALLMTAAPLLMMAVHDRLSARLAGLALTQSLQLAGMLQWMVRQSAEVENNMTSVERMLHYTRLEQEPATLAGGGPKPPPDWPAAGRIEYRDVTAIYRSGLPPVLRDLTFTLEGGVSCGVVGRTGSGKSSLMLTLFRLIPVTSGAILIDGLDTSGVALDALRRQVAIIPQDPVLFSGTLRSNLDPWGTFEDGRLWEALRAAQLGGVVAALGGLDAHMQEAGDNLSVGQRQLFCLARALLQDAAIVALDEATANVDRQTDALIQEAVRQCTRRGDRRRTLLVIAHRIDTIMDCDQLLVLSAGRLLEQGAPGQLAQSGGMFARLVAAARGSSAA
ncbi:hypothetical protein CHLNCDRAFT_138549 [Chlorella variabilis]|uniref:Uncharacterized protein n=1 Tax=Chlorella variabilis TaxID=554065 RepID=E1ZN95_CHLVA|nr:hypothetical protein CHLNCDRAFT_138549 [Chlorella variabilis]EFN52562.1 hypothetical protein CHLNCDRAFT_138549 [Chlorella variabilis]|eukprot:XP_005844664.1 hypothetical protein CHLNCDRAFT_138549 [Chlorella variabilis]